MKVIGKVERTLERWFRKYPGGSTREREPLEIRRAILRDLVDQVQPRGRGEFVFPYSSVRIRAFAGSEQRAQQLRAVLDPVGFCHELDEELAASRCTPTPIEVAIGVEMAAVDAEGADYEYTIEYPSRQQDLRQVAATRPPARLTVSSGTASAQVLEIVSDSVLIGRMREVVESNTGRTRHNDLAFDDSETTVSRKHARIGYDPAAGQFRLFDEPESREGTFIVRAGGQDIECDSRRGVRLRSGDEIRLGRVRILFEIVS